MTRHLEPHKHTGGRFTVSDIILGGQDGLVNVLGVILGVAAASQDPRLIVAAGLAATFAESISMGAVAYTSTISDADHYQAELAREKKEMVEVPDIEREEIRDIYRAKGFDGDLLELVVQKITSNDELWLQTMMREELELEPVARHDALRSAWIVGVSALVGSFVPLLPYFFLRQSHQINTANGAALILAALVLFIAGAYKAKSTVGNPARSGLIMALIGVVSALAGYGIGLIFHVSGVS